MRRRPYLVVLFDEIEKAHRDVFNTLSLDDLMDIVEIQAGRLRVTLAKRQMTLELSEEAKSLLRFEVAEELLELEIVEYRGAVCFWFYERA